MRREQDRQQGKKKQPPGETLTMKVSRKLILAITTLAVMALGSGTPALAETHPLLFSFGSFSNPNGIAIDEGSGHVYVADVGTDSIYKFDAQGKPLNFSSLGGNALSGVGTPAGSFSFPAESGNVAAIAVDNSGNAEDPSAGDLYVLDAGHGVIDKFSPDGTYVSQISGPLAGTRLFGIGIESNGHVRVYAEISSRQTIEVFDNSVTNAFITSLEYGYEKEGIAIFRQAGHGFAVSPTGDMYLLESCGCLEKRGGNMEPLGRVDPGPSSIAAAVDPATGHLYVDDQSSVTEWDTGAMNGQVPLTSLEEDASTGALVSSFGSLQFAGAPEEGGIAVSGTNGNIYISNASVGVVDVFGSTIPAVAAEPATDLTKTTTTLQGTVDPRGASVTSCEFEFEVAVSSKIQLPVATYNQHVPCDQTAAQIGNGTGPVSVTARISGLAPGQLYDFRLVVANAIGTGASSGRFATAGPGFGIESFDISFFNQDGSPDTQAGSHPYKMVTSIVLNTAAIEREKTADSRYVNLPDDNVRDIITDLPPGLVGDPNATPVKCTLAQLEHKVGETEGGGHCPPEAKVGELEVEFGEDSLGQPFKEAVYNMVPPPGVAAQIGANFVIPEVFVNVSLHGGGDYPLEASSMGISGSEPLIATKLTIFGLAGQASFGTESNKVDGRKPFITLPTGCTGPLKSTVRADSYQNPNRFVEASTATHDAAGQPLALSGCSRLEFPPTITVAPDTTDASTSSGLTVGVHISQKAAFNPDGLAESALRDTTVTLPEGVALNPAGADGLEACSEGLAGFTGFDEFNTVSEAGVKTSTFTSNMPSPLQPGVNFCPDGSKIGTVQIRTPLLSHPLEGAVYLAAQNANPFGSLVAMYMFVQDEVSGSIVKLTGEVKLSDTGQIVTTFKNTPDLPFEDLQLHFFGGERAPLTTPSRCGTYTTTAVFTPWDGNGPVTSTSSFNIDHGPNGGPCPGANLPFAPSLTAGATSNQAGGFSPFAMTMSREDGQQGLQSISMKLPPGLSGLLTGVELCPEMQADAGSCGPNSLIGETTVSVGVGNDPFTVTGGRVYLTGPYRGAPFGLSIVNPASAGPYDLGQVVVRAKIEVDPMTAGLTVTSDDEGPYKIPTILDGIPLEIKHVNVLINRPGFTFNPTDCDSLRITGSIASTEGAVSAMSVPFQATNCAALGFAPKFSAATSGRVSRQNGTSLDVRLTYPRAVFGSQANIRQVKVELPRLLPSRLSTLQKACTAAQFGANPAGCPAASVVGHARAITPLVPVPLEGPAYFVSNGGEAFPNLIVVLQGYGVQIDLVGDTFISKTGVTSSTFKTVPDAPVGSFELDLPAGSHSALTATGSLCAAKRLTMPTEFQAQNGARIHQKTKIAVTGCAERRNKHRTRKHPRKTRHARHKRG
jgi:hypothetical protein